MEPNEEHRARGQRRPGTGKPRKLCHDNQLAQGHVSMLEEAAPFRRPIFKRAASSEARRRIRSVIFACRMWLALVTVWRSLPRPWPATAVSQQVAHKRDLVLQLPDTCRCQKAQNMS